MIPKCSDHHLVMRRTFNFLSNVDPTRLDEKILIGFRDEVERFHFPKQSFVRVNNSAVIVFYEVWLRVINH